MSFTFNIRDQVLDMQKLLSYKYKNNVYMYTQEIKYLYLVTVENFISSTQQGSKYTLQSFSRQAGSTSKNKQTRG